MNEHLGLHDTCNEIKSGQAGFYFINCYISFIKNDDKTYYLACPDENCKRKVIEEGNGYKCEHCNKTYDNCSPTYMLLAKISDLSDSIYVNFYREQGNQIMTVSADSMKKYKDDKDQ